MFDELWAGVEFKLGEARFFLDRMGKVLVPAPRYLKTPTTLQLQIDPMAA